MGVSESGYFGDRTLQAGTLCYFAVAPSSGASLNCYLTDPAAAEIFNATSGSRLAVFPRCLHSIKNFRLFLTGVPGTVLDGPTKSEGYPLLRYAGAFRLLQPKTTRRAA
jgi:hypothetical protein